jgi:hypothetical protein
MKKLFVVAAALVLQGCAASAEIQALQAQISATVPTCNSEELCRRKWEAAQVWIAQNSSYKLQIATDVLLETYNPAEYDPGIAVRVLKEPTGSTSYRFVVTVWCANVFGCNPNQYQAAIGFNNTLNSIR